MSVYAVPVSPLSSAGPLQERFGERRRWSMYEVAPERGVHESLTSGRLAAQVAERAVKTSVLVGVGVGAGAGVGVGVGAGATVPFLQFGTAIETSLE